MKKLVLAVFAVSAFASPVLAQAPFNTMDSVDINNISAAVLVHGDMWWNPATGYAMCSHPAHSTKNINFAGSIWLSAYDGSGGLHVAAQTYRQDGNDYWPGPLDGSDTLTYAISHDWAKIWKVNLTDIQTFLSLGTHTLTNTPVSILTWPGKGNTNAQGNAGVPLTITTDMAPFVDLNGNGIYEPLLGEYPAIKGNQALWWIFSDNGPTHNCTNGKALKVEVHAMSYAYTRGTLIDDVVYYDYTIVNKSPNNYNHFRLAQWDDMDLGYTYDDYIGFDSTWRMGITYNGTNCDGCAAGTPPDSYGEDPPQAAITMIMLPGDEGTNYVPVGNFDYYNNDASILGIPTTDSQCNNYMRGLINDSVRFSDDFTGPGSGSSGHGIGPATNYLFPGNPSDTTQWSECVSGNTPGDRRFILSSSDFALSAGNSAHVVMALIVADSAGGCGATSFNKIRIVADTAWGVYHHDDAVKTITPPNAISIYPNPAHDRLCIENNSGATITIYNIIGQALNVPIATSGSRLVADVSALPPGLYVLYCKGATSLKTFKFVKN